MFDFDLLTLKSNLHIYETKYICDQNYMKFPSLVFEILCSQVFRVIARCDFDLWPFDPKCNQHIYDQNFVKFP